MNRKIITQLYGLELHIEDLIQHPHINGAISSSPNLLEGININLLFFRFFPFRKKTFSYMKLHQQSDKNRRAVFDELESSFQLLDDYTTKLGTDLIALINKYAEENQLKDVLSFAPEVVYEVRTGKMSIYVDEDLISVKEYNERFSELDPQESTLMNLKVASYSLCASVSKTTAQKCGSLNVPNDELVEYKISLRAIYENILAMIQTTKDKRFLLYLPKLHVFLLGKYAQHVLPNWMQKSVNYIATTTTFLTLFLGISQVHYWLTYEYDVFWVPQLGKYLDWLVYTPTSFAISMFIWAIVTLGSSIGKSLARGYLKRSVQHIVHEAKTIKKSK